MPQAGPSGPEPGKPRAAKRVSAQQRKVIRKAQQPKVGQVPGVGPVARPHLQAHRVNRQQRSANKQSAAPDSNRRAILEQHLERHRADAYAQAQGRPLVGPKARSPVFSVEGPRNYAAAQSYFRKYAKPGPWATELSPREEQSFRTWVKQHNVPFDVNAHASDYDMRGYWRAVNGQPYAGGHFPDTYKTPLDTSFSRESRYATPRNPFKWVGDTLFDARTGRAVFRSR